MRSLAYQNRTVNDIAPFDTIVPLLESLVEVFGARLKDVVSELDAALLEFDGSETPTRSYMLDYADEAVALQQSEPVAAPTDVEVSEVFDQLLEGLS